MDPALLSMKPVANALGHKLGQDSHSLINDPEWFGEATRSLLSAAKGTKQRRMQRVYARKSCSLH